MTTEYNSFYGGRRGASYIIVKKYDTIKEMVNAFKQGGAYKVVNYDEFVIIDTVNKNDIDNGKIYKRGYDYNNDMGGAEYVGQIVGPAGMAPHVEMKTIKEVDEINTEDGLIDEEGNTYRKTSGIYAPIENLVPGKYEENGQIKYNDSIAYSACSVRDINSHESTVHLGFKFPYTVIDYTASTVNPYYNRDSEDENFTNINLVERIDDQTHPYFEKWHINIPKGIKGDTFKNLRVITPTDIVEDYEGKQDDIDNDRKIFAFDYYYYDKNDTGEPTTLYLGDFNIIDNISINEEGTIKIDYSHDDDTVFNKIFKWVKSIELNGETGHFTVIYNHEQDSNGNSTTYEADLRYVNNMVLSKDGTITLKYTTGPDVILDNKIKWINKIDLASNGTFTVTYNDNSTEVYNKYIQWINSITLDEKGHLEIQYNNGTPKLEADIIWIKNISIDTGETEGEGSQLITITYNNDNIEKIGMPLNYIMEMAIAPNLHVIVLYSDPVRRQQLKEQGKTISYNGRDDWADLGFVGIGGTVGAIAGKESDPYIVELAHTLPPNSAWLIIEDD